MDFTSSRGGLPRGFLVTATLLRALANEIPPYERLITVERALELGLDQFPELHPNVVAFEERLPGSELVGWRYEGPFDTLTPGAGVEHRVLGWGRR